MNLPPDIEDRITCVAARDAKRTRWWSALMDCHHAEHEPRFFAELAATLRAELGETMQLLIDFQELSCDAVEWPVEIPAIFRP